MPRKSKTGQGLPENLYARTVKGKLYYQYRRPDTHTWHAMGTDRAKAVRAARILNAKLAELGDALTLTSKVLAPRYALEDYIAHYRKDLLPQRELSPKTLYEYGKQLDRLAIELGKADMKDLDRRRVSQYMDQFPTTMRNRVRSLLHVLFKHAVAEGVIDVNPIAATLKAPEKVKRQRLTTEGYRAIYTAAEPWYRRVMEVALLTLQRREDLVRLTVGQVKGEWLQVVQQKTKVPLRLHLTPHLIQLLAVSPTAESTAPLLTREDGRRLTLDLVTKTFSRVRDDLRMFQNMEPETRPSFHELRALGARLYKDRGIDPQTLLGHLDPKMTRLYLGRGEPQWVDCQLTDVWQSVGNSLATPVRLAVSR